MAKQSRLLQSRLYDFPQHAATIGMIQDTCNAIEKIGVEVLARCFRITDEQAEAVIYCLQNSRARLDVIEAAIRSTEGIQQAMPGLIDQLNAARKLFGRRNDYIHNMWALGSRGKPHLIDFRKNKASQARAKPVSIKALRAFLDELEICLNNLLEASIFLYSIRDP